MKKNVKISKIIVFLMLLILPITTFAKATCNDVTVTFNNYNNYKNQINSLGCSNLDDLTKEAVDSCNENELRKALELSKLYRYKNESAECFTTEINNTLTANENKCSPILNDEMKSFVNKILKLFYIIGPILLILFGILDFTKAVVASDEKEMKKASSNFTKRLVATLLLLLSPELVNILISFVDFSEQLNSLSGYSCDYTYRTYVNKFNVVAVETPKNTVNKVVNNSFSSTSSIAEVLKQSDPRWGSKNLFCSNETISASGCALISVVMQINNAGVSTIVSNLDPGTFSEKIANDAKCTSGSSINWDPYVSYITDGSLRVQFNNRISGNYQEKTELIKGYIEQGYYPVVQVKHGTYGDSHYVAVFYVQNGEMYVGDPAYINEKEIAPLKHSYPLYSENYSSQVVLFRKN